MIDSPDEMAIIAALFLVVFVLNVLPAFALVCGKQPMKRGVGSDQLSAVRQWICVRAVRNRLI